MALDSFVMQPSGKKEYLSHWGYHFSKKAYQFAVKRMYKKNANGDKEAVKPFTNDEVDELLVKYGVKLENDTAYDKAYVATMAKADYLGSSIADESHLIRFVKDFLDDFDGGKEKAFRHWYSDMIEKDIPILWDDLL